MKLFRFLIFFPILCSAQELEDIVADVLNLGVSAIRDMITRNPVSFQCIKDLESIVYGLARGEIWALRLLDASSKLNPGILTGNTYSFGNYDECLNLHLNIENKTSSITGQYCSVNIILNNNQSLDYYGLSKLYQFKFVKNVFTLCLPESCSIEQLINAWQLFKDILGIPFDLVLENETCLRKNGLFHNYNIDYYINCGFAVLVGVILATTLWEFCSKLAGAKPTVFAVFSLNSSVNQLLHPRQKKFQCLNGIKALSMAWVILGHMTKVKALAPNVNTLYIVSGWLETWTSSFIISSYFAAETFFLISGFILFCNYNQQRDRFSLISFLIKWCSKILPALIATILIYISVIKHMAEGPFWHSFVRKNSETCYSNWWRTITFSNNNIDDASRCIEQTWFLSIVTQLYFATLLFFWAMSKAAKKILYVATPTILLFGLYTFRTLYYQKEVGYIPYIHQNYVDNVLYSFTAHVPSWLIGVNLGCLIKHKLQIPHNKTLFKMSILTMLVLVFFNNLICAACKDDIVFLAVFNSLSRPLWSLALAYVVYGCVTHGGLINNFLSMSMFGVLEKLTFCMFLTHLGIISAVAASKQEADYFSNFSLLLEFCGMYIVVLICSVALFCVSAGPVYAIKHFSLYDTPISDKKKRK